MNTENKSPKMKRATIVAMLISAVILSALSQLSLTSLLALASNFLSIAFIAFLCIAMQSYLPLLASVPAAFVVYFMHGTIAATVNVLLIPITSIAVVCVYKNKLKRAWVDIIIASVFGVSLLSFVALGIYQTYGKLDLNVLTDMYNSFRTLVVESVMTLYTHPQTGEVLISANIVEQAIDYSMLLSPSAIICMFLIVGHVISSILNFLMRALSFDHEYLTPQMIHLLPTKASAVVYFISYLFSLLFESVVPEPIYLTVLNLSSVLTLSFICVGFSLVFRYFLWRKNVKGLGFGSILIIILLVSNLPILIFGLSFVGAGYVLIGNRIKIIKVNDDTNDGKSNQ